MSTITFGWPSKDLSPNSRGHWSLEDDAFLRLHWETKSHAEISVALGRTVKGVRNRCWRLGLVDTSNNWTEDEISRLKSAYSESKFDSEIDLPALALELGRHKTLVCRKARQFGLTDKGRKILPIEKRKIRKPKFASKEEFYKHIGECTKRRLAEKGHPRGALGLKHSEETKRIIGEKAAKWNASLTKDQKHEYAMRSVKARSANGTLQTMNRANASWGAGWREIGAIRKYYRSKWEANYARYLEWLRVKGEIQKWEHEPETFWFEGIKRGCLSYLPDFRVTENSGAVVYHEVKGWMDDRSKTKIRRMAKYHPGVRLIVIESKAYAAIKKVMQPIIKEWEIDSKGR